MEIIFDDGLVNESLTSTTVYHEILQSVQNTHGDYGVACIKVSFKGTELESPVTILCQMAYRPSVLNTILGVRYGSTFPSVIITFT